MIFHYAGKFDGKEENLPQREHEKNMVPFKEPEDMKKLGMIGNIGCFALILLLGIPYVLRAGSLIFERNIWVTVGCVCSMLTLFPHEVLHASCFKKDVYMYTNFKNGLLFVVGTEDMTKARFVFMSLFPNLVFGFLPYLIFLFAPTHVGLGAMGVLCVGMGFGDYMNVYNAIKQMPKGALIYLNGMHSFWYMPEGK